MSSRIKNRNILSFYLFTALLCISLIAINLRPSMAALGPLINEIKKTIDVSFVELSFLTMLPVISMGLFIFVAPFLKRILGVSSIIFISLIIITLANISRYYFYEINSLIISAIIAGVGISSIQALMPYFIKLHFNKYASIFMGLYSTFIMFGATLAAAMTPVIFNVSHSWQFSLSFWAVFSIFGIFAMIGLNFLIQSNGQKESQKEGVNTMIFSFFKKNRAWTLAVFFGISTAAYTCILAWLPPWYIELGLTSEKAGSMLAYMTVCEIVAGFVIPTISAKYDDKRLYLIFLILCTIIGFFGLSYFGLNYLFLWPSILGIGIGGLFPMSLIVAMEHYSDDPHKSGDLVAFTQGIGYIIAGFSPLFAGLIRETTNSFQFSWFMLIFLMLVLLIIAIKFNPNKYHKVM